MSRAASLKRWPGWVLLVLVVAGFLAFGTTRDAGARTPEERVEEISKQLACPVCNGETVYESRNPSSAAIRTEIKSQVTSTDATDDEIIAYIVQQFDYKTQLLPRATGFESLVWVLPSVALVCAAVGLFFAFRRWKANVDTVPDDDDRARVEAALAADLEPEAVVPTADAAALDPAEAGDGE
ncbi:MAG: cytochrome c-type biogenesis protein [Ilumatobacteraceae bacterium]